MRSRTHRSPWPPGSAGDPSRRCARLRRSAPNGSCRGTSAASLERELERSAVTGRDHDRCIELLRQRTYELEPHRLDLVEIEAAGKPDSIVLHGEAELATVELAQRDPDRAGSPVLEPVL